MQQNDWVNPKYDRSKLQRENPPVGGLFCCLRYEYDNPCTDCELDHRGIRIGRHRERGCNADIKNQPKLLARLKAEHEESGSNTRYPKKNRKLCRTLQQRRRSRYRKHKQEEKHHTYTIIDRPFFKFKICAV